MSPWPQRRASPAFTGGCQSTAEILQGQEVPAPIGVRRRALTARDAFALAALIAVGDRVHVPPEKIADTCYAIADAMLVARAKETR
jgi:hypothetical protein